ncbi:uncharacterized protein LOC121728835 [Aricia agestis]|uniref:uncharacterized protein LOC121728835 n=1 Tax=Aricia agestis TaxID=91739 RepID=UPI001C20A324|nr:uncharacterized protein LOC121728835 [Aricia agestis]
MCHKHFGNLAVIRGIVYYRLSPHELKPFAHASQGLRNFVPRTTARIYTWLPTLIGTVAVYFGVEESYRQKLRKNPLDYVNEIDPNTE